jgi:hypothetical protein
MMLKTILILNLLLGSIKTSAQSQPINKGAVAPYSGFIVTKEAFQQTVINLETAEKLKAEYSQFADIEDKRQVSEGAWFLGGFILGGVATFLLMAKVR